jgi:restriction system protein
LQEESEKEEIGLGKGIIARLPKGKRTPEKAFYVPILQAIVDRGGSARMRDVLLRVHELIRGSLKDADNETLSSAPTTPRWRNTAQWARNSLVKEGLMSSDSPHGVWAITQRGKEFLKNS